MSKSYTFQKLHFPHKAYCYRVFSSFLSVSVLQTSAISCMRLKFDYQMNVYELYENGDFLVMNCYCVSSFLPVFGFLQTCAISCMRLKFDYEMAVYELYEYGAVHVMNCYCVSSFLSVFGFYRQVQYLA